MLIFQREMHLFVPVKYFFLRHLLSIYLLFSGTQRYMGNTQECLTWDTSHRMFGPGMSSSPVSCNDPSPCYSQEPVRPGQWTGSSGTRKYFPTSSFLTPPSYQPFELHWLHCKGGTVSELRQGMRQVKGCSRGGMEKNTGTRKGQSCQVLGTLPSLLPASLATPMAQDHISAQPVATRPCPSKQCLLHPGFPQASVVYFSQHLSISPCFSSHVSSCSSVPLSFLSQAIFQPLLSLSTPLTPESLTPDSH